MAKYVDAATAADIICKLSRTPLHKLVDIFAVIPQADVEPVVHARWRRNDDSCRCSVCGCKGLPHWKRCPDCEAKMDAEV